MTFTAIFMALGLLAGYLADLFTNIKAPWWAWALIGAALYIGGIASEASTAASARWEELESKLEELEETVDGNAERLGNVQALVTPSDDKT